MAGGWLGSWVAAVSAADAPLPPSRALIARIFSATGSSCGCESRGSRSARTQLAELVVGGSARASTERLRRLPSPSPQPAPPRPLPCRGIPSPASYSPRMPPRNRRRPLSSRPPPARQDAARGARERQRLQGDVAGAGHVDEEQPFAAEQALRDAALHLHLVVDGRLDHHHAARIDDESLAGRQVEVDEVAAAVQPHRPLALQPLQEEALAAAADAHAERCANALSISTSPMVTEVGVLLADDLAVELVLADRAGEGPGDADGTRAVRRGSASGRGSRRRAACASDRPRARPASRRPSMMSPETNIIAPASEVSCSPGWSATMTAGA